MKQKRLKLRAAPLLLTSVGASRWADGVLLVSVESGGDAGALALGPHAMLKLLEGLRRASMDSAAPFNIHRRTLRPSVAQEEANHD